MATIRIYRRYQPAAYRGIKSVSKLIAFLKNQIRGYRHRGMVSSKKQIKLKGLIYSWCDRRALNPLARVLGPYVAFDVPVQPVDATQALNLSAGVSNPRVLRGRSLSWRATLFRWACEYTDRSAPFGKYCLSRPLVFSLEPRCHGLCGSQK